MKIIKSFFNDDVKILEFKKYKDERGFFYENLNLEVLKLLKLSQNFVQDNVSYSANKGIIRGLHIQQSPYAQGKLISVLNGKILDVFVDLRSNSKTFGNYESIIISSNDDFNLYIPSGFAHGFSVLEENTLVYYKTSEIYSSDHEVTIMHNDEYLNIDWKIKSKKIISNKDLNGIKFSNAKNYNFL